MVETLQRRDPFGLAGVVLDGRFRVEREVAEGGFGIVYYAIQVALDRPVALKVLKTPPGMDDIARAHFHDKFAAEAKTIARMRHPNIVDVYDFGISKMPSGVMAPWMALEWLRGKTLEDHLSERRGQRGQSPAEVLALLRPVFRAVAYAHREGIAHRDIKPANIMIVFTDATSTATEQAGTLRVLDFGIAKLMNNEDNPGSGMTRTSGMPAFSPLYAAPEQVAFGRTGPWTDVHALGLIALEMLVDELPYRSGSMQLFEEVLATKRPTPAARGCNVGPWESVLAKAVALSPGERWKGAAEFLAALEATVTPATAAASEVNLDPQGRTLPFPLSERPTAALLDTAATPNKEPTDSGEVSARAHLGEKAGASPGGLRARHGITLAAVIVAVALGAWLVSSRAHGPTGAADPAPPSAQPLPQHVRAPSALPPADSPIPVLPMPTRASPPSPPETSTQPPGRGRDRGKTSPRVAKQKTPKPVSGTASSIEVE